MLFKTRSVHGFGMRRPILVVAIGRDFTVIGSTVLGPNRIAFYPRARYLLEMPIGREVPAVGSRIEIGFDDG